MRITFQYEHKYEPDIETHIKCITRTLVKLLLRSR